MENQFFDANLQKKNVYRKYLSISGNKGWLVFKRGFCLGTFLRFFNEIFVNFVGVKSSFRSACRKNFFFKKIVFDIAHERLVIFQYDISSHSELQSKIWLI